MTTTPLSLIDFCTVYGDEAPGASIRRSVAFAQRAERLGYGRIWYAEHHNMPSITSSAPAVLIAHIGAHTERIRLGSGGVMLPNHSPYVIAEQFGMLAEMYPGRIDLGLGRAPGTDMNTLGRALRRDPNAADNFPHDVIELGRYLAGDSPVPGVQAMPGAGTNVPRYILGSSMFGATLAARLGLPYAFASHFAPTHLKQATRYYRENFEPSEELSEPYLIAAVNVTASDDESDAHRQNELVRRRRLARMVSRGEGRITEEQLDQLVDSPQGQQVLDMLRYTAVGTAPQIREYLEEFRDSVGADELMVSAQGPTAKEADRSVEILAEAWGLEPNGVAAGDPRER